MPGGPSSLGPGTCPCPRWWPTGHPSAALRLGGRRGAHRPKLAISRPSLVQPPRPSATQRDQVPVDVVQVEEPLQLRAGRLFHEPSVRLGLLIRQKLVLLEHVSRGPGGLPAPGPHGDKTHHQPVNLHRPFLSAPRYGGCGVRDSPLRDLGPAVLQPASSARPTRWAVRAVPMALLSIDRCRTTHGYCGYCVQHVRPAAALGRPARRPVPGPPTKTLGPATPLPFRTPRAAVRVCRAPLTSLATGETLPAPIQECLLQPR